MFIFECLQLKWKLRPICQRCPTSTNTAVPKIAEQIDRREIVVEVQRVWELPVSWKGLTQLHHHGADWRQVRMSLELTRSMYLRGLHEV